MGIRIILLVTSFAFVYKMQGILLLLLLSVGQFICILWLDDASKLYLNTCFTI